MGPTLSGTVRSLTAQIPSLRRPGASLLMFYGPIFSAAQSREVSGVRRGFPPDSERPHCVCEIQDTAMKTLAGLKSEHKDRSRYPGAGRAAGLSPTEGLLGAAATGSGTDDLLHPRAPARGAGKPRLVPPSFLPPHQASGCHPWRQSRNPNNDLSSAREHVYFVSRVRSPQDSVKQGTGTM